nr:hypothetical protein [Alphaproteobacteria bacterium]
MLKVLQGLVPSTKKAGLAVGMSVLIFLIVSLGVLLSDVTRDDVTTLHNGLDGTKFANAEVGSFFEVSTDRVLGPLCEEVFSNNDQRLRIQSKIVTVINKLGETLPLLTALTNAVSDPPDNKNNGPKISNILSLPVIENSVTSATLWEYSRNIMNNKGGKCRKYIDTRTKFREVRICPVSRVWKNKGGETEAVFFDSYAINGCPGNDPSCTDKCPQFAT